MKILITGAAGRLGRAAHQALAADHAVVGLDRLPSATTDLLADLADLADPAADALLRRALEGVDAVIHGAALHAPHVGLWPDRAFERINVAATARLAALAQQAGVRRFVFASTTALYGHAATPEGRAGWVDEDLEPQPRTIYHRSKRAAEALLREAAAAGLAVTVLRIARCFAEPAPLMAAYRLHRGIDASDVAQAMVLALQGEVPPWRLFVVSGATPFLPTDAEALWHDAPAVLAQRAPALLQAFAQRGWLLPPRIDRIYSAARAQQGLGWQPRHGFDEVLRQLDAGAPEVLAPG